VKGCEALKISEVTVDIIKQYGVIDNEDDDNLIETVFMPSAKAHIADYTGLNIEGIDQKESLTMAYIALCVFLYDNRSMNIINDKQNAVIQSFLDSHCVNLV
jgi:hypothetical protein